MTTYQTYTLSPRGAFQTKYNGTSEEAARKAYKKLEQANKPRILNFIEDGLTKQLETWGLYN